MKGYTKPVLLILFVLLIDQGLKIWVKNHMFIGQEFKILGNWFIIHFIENNGMAYGLELGGNFGKLILSLFRIVAIFGIGYGLHHLIKHKYNRGLILCIALVFAGALGNIIDSVFYGVAYGYSSWFHGAVVDMLYFPLIEGNFPSWFPIWSGEEFIFFRPIFNIADASIFIGVAIILVFQKRYFKADIPTTNHTNTEILED